MKLQNSIELEQMDIEQLIQEIESIGIHIQVGSYPLLYNFYKELKKIKAFNDSVCRSQFKQNMTLFNRNRIQLKN